LANLDFTMHKIFILGYSESFISLLLETLKVNGIVKDIVIVKNTEVKEQYPFRPAVTSVEIINSAQWRHVTSSDRFVFGVGSPSVKRKVFESFRESHGITKENFLSVRHPFNVTASSALIGKGCYCEPSVILSPFSSIGFGVTINRGVTIGHHTVIKDFATIYPGTHIAGHCVIEEGVHIGMGTSVFNNVKIGAGSVIGGGSTVTEDIPGGVTAWGSPCKIIKSADHAG